MRSSVMQYGFLEVQFFCFGNFGKIVVIIEVLSGYVMFGILITLVARKMTRS